MIRYPLLILYGLAYVNHSNCIHCNILLISNKNSVYVQ